MSVNRHLPHVLVLPEDDANRQLANGFLLDPYLSTWKIQVLEEAGGWIEVLDRFVSDHIAAMNRYADRYMVLLIDFDAREERRQAAMGKIPETLRERVFILGTWTEPEDLKRAGLGTYEAIGKLMAQDCREQTSTTWGHDLLRHNTKEIDRLRDRVCPILFPAD
ncbi:MAG TPA: hypothetical protein VEU96_25330 [Bryobacteraceae bacterium]|nr:hypothetical protein [Bryobacteraceae bacterium]